MKKKAPKGWVKISDFEETTGISAKTITAAIKRGYIPDNFADVVGTSATSPYYLNPQQAAVCWYKSLNSAHPNQRKVRNALAGYIKTFDKAVIEPEPTAKAVATATMTYEDAQLQEKIAKARIAELEFIIRKSKCSTDFKRNDFLKKTKRTHWVRFVHLNSLIESCVFLYLWNSPFDTFL